ncbi:hypothetical protein ACQP2Y_23335 [Actinoplanes sp. CA-051413]|uniref:hypothetical protein n=1 Tax=Actinoplanes sp. CA-051413 TaxID=3239899 RepID=UPI003D95DB7E
MAPRTRQRTSGCCVPAFVALDFHVPGRGDIVIERVGAGGVVGWSWLLPPYPWTGNAS